MAFFRDTISDISNSLGHLGNTAMELPGRCLRNSRRENEQDAETREAVINPYLIGGAIFVLGLGLKGRWLCLWTYNVCGHIMYE